MLSVMVFLWNNDGLAQNLLVRPSRLRCVTAIGLLAQDPFMECMSYVRFANYLFSVCCGRHHNAFPIFHPVV